MNVKGYGKTLGHPVLLNSVSSSMAYLRNLVTKDKGYHIIFHRIGSRSTEGKPVDHYQIMTSSNAYDDIYISIYSSTNNMVPPDGYLFEDSLMDGIMLEDKYVFTEDLSDLDSISEYVSALPPLERHLGNSCGINARFKDFPYDLIKDLYHSGELEYVNDINELLKKIKKF